MLFDDENPKEYLSALKRFTIDLLKAVPFVLIAFGVLLLVAAVLALPIVGLYMLF